MDRAYTACGLTLLLIISNACTPAPEIKAGQPPPQEEKSVISTATHAPLAETASPAAVTAAQETPVIQNRTMTLSSPAIEAGGTIHAQYTCLGQNISPLMEWSAPPDGTKSLALIVDDVDAPAGVFVHWVLFNIPADRKDLPQGVLTNETVAGVGVQGKNDAGKTGYFGPCPPEGLPHRYYFRLYALDTRLFLPAGSSRKDLDRAMENHVLAQTEFYATFQRPKQTSGG